MLASFLLILLRHDIFLGVVARRGLILHHDQFAAVAAEFKFRSRQPRNHGTF